MQRERVRQILCQLIQQEPNLAYDSIRCRGMLLDFSRGWFVSEISNLVSGIEKGIVERILALPSNYNSYDKDCLELETNLVQLLQSKSSLKLEDAQWVVRSWLEALKDPTTGQSVISATPISIAERTSNSNSSFNDSSVLANRKQYEYRERLLLLYKAKIRQTGKWRYPR